MQAIEIDLYQKAVSKRVVSIQQEVAHRNDMGFATQLAGNKGVRAFLFDLNDFPGESATHDALMDKFLSGLKPSPHIKRRHSGTGARTAGRTIHLARAENHGIAIYIPPTLLIGGLSELYIVQKSDFRILGMGYLDLLVDLGKQVHTKGGDLVGVFWYDLQPEGSNGEADKKVTAIQDIIGDLVALPVYSQVLRVDEGVNVLEPDLADHAVLYLSETIYNP